MELQTHEQRMLVLARLQLEYARQRDKAIQERIATDHDQERVLEQRQRFASNHANIVNPITTPTAVNLIQAPVEPPKSHPVKLFKAKARAVPPPKRTWQECLELAQAQYESYIFELGKAFRIAVQVRALALFTNPHAKPSALLPVFVPSITALSFDLELSESYVFRILAGKVPGARKTERRVKRGGKWYIESKNTDLKLFMSWRTWWTDWECKAAQPSRRFSEGGRRTVKGGTVFYTRPQPALEGSRQSIPAEWLSKRWRDLESDTASKLTARAIRKKEAREIVGSVSNPNEEESICECLKATCYLPLTHFSTLNSGVVMDAELEPRTDVYAVLDMLSAPLQKGHDARTKRVDGLANAIYQVLRETNPISLEFWRKVLWTLLKAQIHGIAGALEILQGALWEVLVASSDNALIRRPGALASTILYRNGWHEIEQAVSSLFAGDQARA
jgi:hypothetical protein